MDYGKLAYLKVEDLERLVGSVSSKQQDFCGGKAVFEVDRTINGDYALTDISVANGNICLIIKLVASANENSFIDILIGGKKAARQTILSTADGRNESGNEYLVMLQKRLSNTEILSLDAHGVFVESVELLVIGGTISGGSRRLSGDSGGGRAVVVLCSSDNITLFEGEEGNIDFAGSKAGTIAKAADACFLKDKFYVALLDLCGNIWLCCLDDGGGYRFVDSGGENSVSLCGWENGLCIASTQNGKLVACSLDSFEGSTAIEDVDMDVTAQSVYFAKGGDLPLLTVKNHNGTSLLVAEKQINSRDTVGVKITATWS